MIEEPQLLWHVVHSRPRCEKKVAEYCAREKFFCELPLYRSVRKYRGKSVTFLKPFFPGYVFVRIGEQDRMKMRQSQHCARLLSVPDQAGFEHQLMDIAAALESGLEVRLAPQIRAGMRVKIKAGPLRGLEGWVESRSGMIEVHLRLDFIGQAAAVRIAADELEPS